MSIDLRTVRLVAAKELRESLRDRRTLFVALLLPVLLYPLMMLAIAPLVSMQKQKLADELQPIAVTGPYGPKFFDVMGQITTSDGSRLLSLDTLKIVPSADPARDLAAGTIALWVEVSEPPDLLGERPVQIVVRRDGSSDVSLTAERKFADAMAKVAEFAIELREEARGLPKDWHKPLKLQTVDVAPPSQRAAYLFGKMLAFVLVVLTLSSSFYPAIDSVAGEKERGTMETLLVAPCGRAELVLGKFVAVMTVTLAAALLNLASMGLTLGPFMGLVVPDLGSGIAVTPTVLVGIMALLVPLSALFSALSLALSTLARSVKEGQHYLTPAFLVVMPLAMVVILPNVPLTGALAAVPVTNAVLFFRDLLLGKTDAGTTTIVMVSSFAYAAAALWGCVALFLREETLFRGPEGGTALIARPAPRERPTGAAALFVFAVGMALMWYGQEWLPKSIVRNVLATQLLVILTPCLLVAWWMRVKPVVTFRLRTPGGAAFLAALLVGLAAPILNDALRRAFGETHASEAMQKLEREIVAFVGESPALAALLIGVLPAICEELFFRGFVQTGLAGAFRGRFAELRAVLLTSALFAVFHLSPERYLPTFLMGLLLGLLAVRTGSIWPGVLAHAINNASVVLQAWTPVHDAYEAVPYPVPIAGAVMAAGLAIVVLVPCRTPQPDPSG